MNNYLNVYNACLNKKYHNSNLELVLNDLYNLVSNAEDWIMLSSLTDPDVVNSIRSKIMETYLAMIQKMIRRNKIEDFKYNIDLALSLRMDVRLIPKFFDLLFFSNELLKNDFDINQISNYRYIIEMLLTYNVNYYLYNNNKLLDYVRTALNYLEDNKREYNIFLPSIILYCLIKNYDNNKYIEMLNYSFKYYSQLIDFINMYDDYHHMDELYDLALERIDTNFDFDSLIIK